MKSKILLFLCILCTSFSVYGQETAYVEGEIIVMLNHESLLKEFMDNNRSIEGISIDLVKENVLSELSAIYLFSFNGDVIEDHQVLRNIRNDRNVRAAQFNHIITDRALPNDPSIGSQWHHVDGSDNDIDSDLAWDTTTGGVTATGDNIVVCVIEGGGSNYNHVDLIDNHWTNGNEIDGNGVDDDGNGFVDDVNGWNPVGGNDNIGTGGHGTAVSGMIGAKGNNNSGGAGVNWDVDIMQVTIGSLNEANVIAAYNYPYAMRDLYNSSGGTNGAFVVATNASWGIDNANPANYPVWCAYYDDLGAVGILNCGATANNNVNIDVVGDMPTGCSSDYMIAVTATNSSDVRTFSGYGATTIDLGAPGESVFLPSGSTGYSSTSGTSFASPCVAGAIALVYSTPCTDIGTLALNDPQGAADLIRSSILDGVDVVGNLVGETVTGGRLNVKTSIDLVIAQCGATCDPIGLTATPQCQVVDGVVESGLLIDVELSESFCNVETLCYATSGGTFTCLDLNLLGINLNNGSSYFLSGLTDNISYDVYYTTADGISSTITVTTDDCSSILPGCTDPSASNYDINATLDDGSCIYPCTDITITLDTDCWGGEVSWVLQDDLGNVIASVTQGSLGNQTNYNWSYCLEDGCYDFIISDSFGDGMNGTAFGCAVDGNYTITDGGGNTLVQMGNPDYDFGITHNFCLVTTNDTEGCTDASACNYNPNAGINDGSCIYGLWYLPNNLGDGPITLACDPPAGYFLADQVCAQTVVDNDPFCVNSNWDSICEEAYQCCLGNFGCDDPNACNYEPLLCSDNTLCTYPGCTDVGACNYISLAGCDDGSCEYLSCAGCTDSTACNFDSTATIEDGSCVAPLWYLPNVLGSGPIVLACEAPVDYFLADQACAQTVVDNDPFCVDTNWDGICESAYQCCLGNFGCNDPIACNFDPTLCEDNSLCEYPGCIDSGACNYDSTASCDDGSCEYLSCAGCTDSTACNFDSTATIEDGSCVAPLWYLPNVLGSGPIVLACEAPADYFLADQACAQTVVDNDPFCVDTNWDGICESAYQCCLGNFGCNDPAACNYDSTLCEDNTLCEYPGCNDSTACNYDSTAGCDDGSCTYAPCGTCPGDANTDGFVNILDLVSVSSNFGCTEGCLGNGDANFDTVVDILDLIAVSSNFGSICD